MGLLDFVSLGGVGAVVGVFVIYGVYIGMSAAVGGMVLLFFGGVFVWMSGGVIFLGGGLVVMVLIGGVGAVFVIVILGVLSDKKMKKVSSC